MFLCAPIFVVELIEAVLEVTKLGKAFGKDTEPCIDSWRSYDVKLKHHERFQLEEESLQYFWLAHI